MSDIRSDMEPRKLPDKYGENTSAQGPGSNKEHEPGRNPAWLVLEILLVTVLVFFWL